MKKVPFLVVYLVVAKQDLFGMKIESILTFLLKKVKAMSHVSQVCTLFDIIEVVLVEA